MVMVKNKYLESVIWNDRYRNFRIQTFYFDVFAYEYQKDLSYFWGVQSLLSSVNITYTLNLPKQC